MFPASIDGLYWDGFARVCQGTGPERDEKWDPKSGLHAFKSFIPQESP